MDPETLNFWANVSTVFLLCNAAVLAVVSGIGLGIGWWYIRKGRKALGTPFLMAQVYSLRLQIATTRVTDRIAAVPIQIDAAATQVTTTAKVLKNSLARTIGR